MICHHSARKVSLLRTVDLLEAVLAVDFVKALIAGVGT
jgi:hypothetical protein